MTVVAKKQRRRPGRPIIGGVAVEVSALLGLAHRCRPERCRSSRFCCSAYEVEADEAELEMIVGLMPEAVRYASGLFDDGEWANIFEEGEGVLYTLDTDETGRCIFAYRRGSGERRCALHSAALDLGLPPYQAKPKCCALWPLALWETNPPVLGLHEDAFSFACNTRRSSGATDLDPGVAALIRENFGPAFFNALNDYLSI